MYKRQILLNSKLYVVAKNLKGETRTYLILQVNNGEVDDENDDKLITTECTKIFLNWVLNKIMRYWKQRKQQ